MAGLEQALVDRPEVESGLNANEIHSLTRSSFRFATEPATVTVEADSSKRRVGFLTNREQRTKKPVKMRINR